MKKLLLFFLPLLITSCATKSPFVRDYKVILEQNESFITTGSNIVQVKEGGSATFEITMKRGFEFKSINHGEYVDGVITINDVYASTRIVLSYEIIPQYKVTVVNDENKGLINPLPESILEGESVTLSCNTNHDYYFSGWSLNDTLENGGELLSMDETYTFEPTADTKVCTNFIGLDEGEYIFYYVNGGKMLDGSSHISYLSLIPTFTDIVKNPNTSIGTDKIYYDGHTLYSWNTKSDGTGVDIGLGSRLEPKNGRALYAKWVEWTDKASFDYVINDDKVEIKKYNGNDNFVVVPAYIDDLPVTTILENAFVSKNVEEVVFPITLETVCSSSFNSCPKLKSIKMFDNLKHIYDDSFVDTNHLTTLKINAVLEPRFTDISLSFVCNAIDYIKTIEGKKIIPFGSSNVYYGLDTETFLANCRDYKYGLCSSYQEVGLRMYAELALSLANEGDILLGIPIYYKEGFGKTNYMHFQCYEVFESNYDLMQIININEFEKVFSTFTNYNEIRKNTHPKNYNLYFQYRDKYGYYFLEKEGQDPDYHRVAINFDAELFTASLHNFFDDYYLRCANKGVDLYIAPTPYDNVEVEYTGCDAASFQAMYNLLFPTALYSVATFSWPGNYFYNAEYHLSTAGAIEFTEDLLHYLWNRIDS